MVFLVHFPHLIQVIVSVLTLVLAAWTLAILRRYAADTKKIAEASVAQLEHSQTPFLDVIMVDLPPHSGWQIQNQGFGPALNVKCSFVQGRPIPSLAQGATHMVNNEFPAVVAGRVEADIQYESLSCSEYRTFITWEGEIMKTIFQNLRR